MPDLHADRCAGVVREQGCDQLTDEQTGREALVEMRRLVGVLRNPGEAPALWFVSGSRHQLDQAE